MVGPLTNTRLLIKVVASCRVKCDEQEPSCQRCIKIGTECPGYKRPVKWSTKYEKTAVSDRNTANVCRGKTSRLAERDQRLPVLPENPTLLAPTHLEDVPRPIETREFDTVLVSGTLKSIGTIRPFQDCSGEVSALLHYYFSTVCHVLSSFDSLHNPFRSEVPRLFSQSPLLLYCVLSMSAAHLYQNEESKIAVPLELQTKAISYLAGQLPTPPPIDGLEVSIRHESTVGRFVGSNIQDDVLLGTVLLGMTSAWHDVSSTGLVHLHGSREVFKAWMSSSHLNTTNDRRVMGATQDFVISSMVYWEAMSSFIVDQDTDALSYLDVFCHLPCSLKRYPCPWTGVGTAMFIYLAKTAALVRRLRALRRSSSGMFQRSDGIIQDTSYYSDLLRQATALIKSISALEAPTVSSFTDIGDVFTPLGHLIAMEQCYRLAALLELTRAFPEVVGTHVVQNHDAGLNGDEQEKNRPVERVCNLALRILWITEGIPVTSGTVSTQLLPLIIAGSVLGLVSRENIAGGGIESLGSSKEVARWRDFVRTRTRWLYQLIRLKPVRHGLLILEEVWARLDNLDAADCSGDLIQKSQNHHWIDVMEERGLETMLG
ncbi:hypothetical protein CABS03_02574 [Colletotrichum abscissum]